MTHEQWIEQFAAQIGMSYTKLMEAADFWLEGELDNVRWNDNYTFMGDNEGYKNPNEAEWHEFWTRYAAITGQKTIDKSAVPFSCSC